MGKKKTVLSNGLDCTIARSAESPSSYPESHRISHALYGILDLGEALARIEKKIDALKATPQKDDVCASCGGPL